MWRRPRLAGIGITNQRETTIVWRRDNGEPIYPAIVWQDRRTAEFCSHWVNASRSRLVAERTGLLVDPYFCASKLRWILDHVDGARADAEAGRLAFGTVDCWLLWNLTAGRVHATDSTNAARTLLFDIRRHAWDDDLLREFEIPRALLPEVFECAAEFGESEAECLGAAVPIRGIAGDQQAATVGQACFDRGMIKSTYGTGCFIVLNTGEAFVQSRERLLTTIAYRLGGCTTYALEGSIFVAGAAVQWLRDAMRLIKTAAESERARAQRARCTRGLSGAGLHRTGCAVLGCPLARGAIFGLTRDTGVAHIVRAALESVCYQTRDLLDAMVRDAGAITELRVDGGMVVNDWLVQHLADIVRVPVVRPTNVETTALGAAYLAGLQAGVYGSLEAIQGLWQAQARFAPRMPEARAETLRQGWGGGGRARALPSKNLSWNEFCASCVVRQRSGTCAGNENHHSRRGPGWQHAGREPRQRGERSHGGRDTDTALLTELQERLDIRVIYGYPSHPSTLRRAGADDADMLIAVTEER